jgi:hypothetical protein
MHIDTASFFMLVGSLAAGGAGGYAVGKTGVVSKVMDAGEGPQGSEHATPATTASTPATIAAPAAPVCDDTTGAPGDCPPPSFYSAEEGGCGAFPVKRCTDFKLGMKPKVAAQAVACIDGLKPYERCDKNRVGLCAHAALMSACAPDDPPPADLGADCDAIQRACGASPMAPSLRDCEATLAGMTEAGRKGTVECMTTQCADKGLLGCEAVLGSHETTMVQ